MQDELKVDAAHFWERSLVLMDRFESQTDLGYVLFHAIAPYCELAITHDLGLWGFREIPCLLYTSDAADDLLTV